MRGHSLLWAKRSNNPDWVQQLYGTELMEAIISRLDFTLQHYGPLGVQNWDVINEMVDQGAENHTFYQVNKIIFRSGIL